MLFFNASIYLIAFLKKKLFQIVLNSHPDMKCLICYISALASLTQKRIKICCWFLCRVGHDQLNRRQLTGNGLLGTHHYHFWSWNECSDVPAGVMCRPSCWLRKSPAVTDPTSWQYARSLQARNYADAMVNVLWIITTNSGMKTYTNSVALVREPTIPTERLPHVGEVSAKFRG
jgi:hypothetical protein